MPHDFLLSNAARFVGSRRSVALAAAFVVSSMTFASPAVHAQEAAAGASSQQQGNAAGSLATNVEDFWHYAKIARYDAANAKASAILAGNPDPSQLLAEFEKVATRQRGDDLTQTMVRFLAVPELAESVSAIEKILVEGRYARRTDAKFIESNIQRLITNQIGYQNGLANLRNSGEMAVPLLLDYLRDPNRAQYHDAARRALKDLGRVALNPLVAATEMKDVDTLSTVVNLLGELGYDDVAPYIQRVAQASKSETLKAAAQQAMGKIGASTGKAVDASFYELAEKLYAGRSAIAADTRNPMAFVWYWTEGQGLLRKEVPADVFAEIMTLRAAEYALQSGGQSDVGDKAMSLWLAANYKRQVELGETPDPTRMENQPNAHYYGVTSGPKYLGGALKRALDDGDSAVAFEILKSEQEIIGNSTLNVDAEGQSLVQSLSYPDRKVRYEAALALAAARPDDAFTGSDLVVPLLGEALSQTGKATALVVAADTDKANALAEPLKGAGYEVSTSTSASGAANEARNLPAVDVVVFDGTMPPDQIEGLMSQLSTSPKLKGSARLALVQTTQSPFEERKQRDPLLSTAVADGGEALTKAVEDARAKGGALPIDAAVATDYALRSATMLKQIGTTGGVYDLSVVKPTLLRGLNDARPEVVTAIAEVLTQLDAADVQQSLLARASATDLSPELRITLYKALAANAKQFGNKLGDAVSQLETAVTDEANLDIRGAAAEARGALNLSADQAKSIILKQVQR